MAAYRTRQVHELLRDATLIRSTIDVAAGHDLPGVVGQLARRNDAVDAVGAAPTSADRRAVRLEAEARLLLDDPDGADRRLATADPYEPGVARGPAPRRPRPGPARPRAREARRCGAAHHHRQPAARRPPVPVLEPRRAGGPRAPRPTPRGLRRRPGAGRGRRRRHPHEHRAVAGDLAPHQPGDDSPRPRDHHEDPRAASAASPRGRRRRAGGRRRWRCASPPSRRRCRSGSGASRSPSPTGSATGPVDADEARAAAADRSTTVVEFFEVGDRLWTVVLADGANPGAPHRHAWPRCPGSSRGCAATCAPARSWPPGRRWRRCSRRATAASLAALDAALNPTGATDARVAVIPSRTLAAVPWSLLPSLRGRPVTVAPSLTRWVRGPSSHRRHPVVAAGRGAVRTGPVPDRAGDPRHPGRLVRQRRRGRDHPGVERGRAPRARVRSGRPPGGARHPRGAEPAVLVGAGGRRSGVRPRVPPAGRRGARRALGLRRGPVLHPPRRRAPRPRDRPPVARCDERARGRRPGRRPRGRRGHGRATTASSPAGPTRRRRGARSSNSSLPQGCSATTAPTGAIAADGT